jgi:hypothetical protein
VVNFFFVFRNGCGLGGFGLVNGAGVERINRLREKEGEIWLIASGEIDQKVTLTTAEQGCQIFLCTTCKNWDKRTK